MNPTRSDYYTKGELLHRAACQSQGHVECRAGPLWQCRGCHRRFCMEDGAADALPHLCDECAAAAKAGQEETP